MTIQSMFLKISNKHILTIQVNFNLEFQDIVLKFQSILFNFQLIYFTFQVHDIEFLMNMILKIKFIFNFQNV